MIVKVGQNVALNMTAVSSVIIDVHEEVKKAARLFSAATKEKTYAVVIQYKDENSKNSKYTLYGFHDYQEVIKVRDSVISQIKELEIERVSTEFENAIRGS